MAWSLSFRTELYALLNSKKKFFYIFFIGNYLIWCWYREYKILTNSIFSASITHLVCHVLIFSHCNGVVSGLLLTAVNQRLHHWRCRWITARRHSRNSETTVSCTESDSGVTEWMHRSPAYTSSVPASDVAQSSVAILGLVNSHEGCQLQVC